MRLAMLDSGHGAGTKLLFGFIRAVTRQSVPEMVKLLKARPDFLGAPFQPLVHQIMRGPSDWSVGDRELMAACVSQANACPYCMKTHSAVAAKAYKDGAKVAAALADLDAAPLAPPLRATLRLLQKLTRTGALDADDMREVLVAGASRPQIEDALDVAYAFTIINRLANAFDFAIPGAKAFEVGAIFLLKRGYR